MTNEQRNLVESYRLLGFDFYTTVAAIQFNKKPIDVTPSERKAAKVVAYKYLYR